MSLFQLGDFTLRSGRTSRWKIECDALTSDDWAALALIASQQLGPFRYVEGVPRGGLPFADALLEYATYDPAHPFLIAEDVVTTGGSMIRFRESLGLDKSRDVKGVAVFARGDYPLWVQPIFCMMYEPLIVQPVVMSEGRFPVELP